MIHNTHRTYNERINEWTSEWMKKAEVKRINSENGRRSCCVLRLLLFCVGFSHSLWVVFCSVRFDSILFDSILFVPHTVRGILSHYSVFNRTFNLFRCRSNSLLYSNLIFTSYLADLVQWKDSQSKWMNKRTICNLLLSVSSFIFANCFDNYGENEAKCFRMNYSN